MSNENEQIICANTGKPMDFGWCNVMFDQLGLEGKSKVVPAEYIQHDNWQERCKNCPVYNEYTK